MGIFLDARKLRESAGAVRYEISHGGPFEVILVINKGDWSWSAEGCENPTVYGKIVAEAKRRHELDGRFPARVLRQS